MDENQDVEGFAACDAEVTAGEALLLELNAFAIAAIRLSSCNNITPQYLQTINEDMCNGLVAGLGIIFVTWTVGSIGLMIAMYCYLLLDFESDDVKIPVTPIAAEVLPETGEIVPETEERKDLSLRPVIEGSDGTETTELKISL